MKRVLFFLFILVLSEQVEAAQVSNSPETGTPVSVITTGVSSQTVFNQNTYRFDCLIQNLETTDNEYIAFKNVAASTTTFKIPPGGNFSCASANVVISDQVNIIGDNVGDKYYGVEFNAQGQ